MSPGEESEWKTLKQRIDSMLDAASWKLKAGSEGSHRTEQEKSGDGAADYALWLDRKLIGIVEAKIAVGPRDVLARADRSRRGVATAAGATPELPGRFRYATDGEVFWFHDARDPSDRPRRIAGFHTPAAFRESLGRDLNKLCEGLLALPNGNQLLRPYQRDANTAIEKAIASRKREMLVAMATGTGKTYTVVNQIYRLLKSGVARRVLLLVDRRALAAQAALTFSTFEAEKGLRFDDLYEVTSNRFQPGDLGPSEKLNPKIIPNHYLTDPKPGQVFVYICSLQRMAINVLGSQAVFAGGEEVVDEDLKRLKIPIHAFDVIVSDECHRGYTASEVSVWRETLDHFDAIKIGVTATPATQTTKYFKSLVYRYDYPQAVQDGFLVDYDVVTVHSGVHIKGRFLEESERVDVIDPVMRLRKRDRLYDERDLAATEAEAKITAPEPNRLMVEELRKCALAHETAYGRFPKTLVFAANDLPNGSHADEIVSLCRDAFGRGDAFVQKITSRANRPLQRIREFRDRPNPGIAVTVDLLANGVDIPDLEFLVFLRPVKSRIFFEQMLGLGARRGEKYPDKSHFTVFDCFEGDLLRYFRESTGITAEPPDSHARPIAEVIEDIWANRDRSYNLGCLLKRLRRIDKQITAEARQGIGTFIPAGDLARYAEGLPKALKADFVGSMALLRNPSFQDLLVNYPRPPRQVPAAEAPPDQVCATSTMRKDVGDEGVTPGPATRAGVGAPPVRATRGKVAGPVTEDLHDQVPMFSPAQATSAETDFGSILEPDRPRSRVWSDAQAREGADLVPQPDRRRGAPVAKDTPVQVHGTWHAREPGDPAKPDDYLAGFEKFVRDNPEQIQAIGILLGRPSEWGPGPLTELKTKLGATPQQFTVENLQKAHKTTYRRNRVDLISMVKHAANQKEPLLTAAERVERAFKRVAAEHTFTPDQEKWLGFIREHLRENLSIDEVDFDNVPVFARQGGRAMVRKLFKHRLPELLHDLNEALVV